VARSRKDDACPGALHLHQAADGALARVRLPGGMITAGQLESVAEAAERFAAGIIELTARGNLQVRGITDTSAVADAVAAAGLLPSSTHERVRNIVASPLSGRLGGVVDVRPWVTALDHAIQAGPDLAQLPGRFWFSIDDGSADVSGLAADVGVHAIDAETVALLLAGRDTGIRLTPDAAIGALVTIASRFAETRGNAWRIGELDAPGDLLIGFAPTGPAGATFTPVNRPTVGWIEQDDGKAALGAAVPLGVLSVRQAQFVAAIDAPIVITPWRSLLVCDLAEEVADTSLRVLPPLGLVFDATSPWLEVSSCVGSPGCERSRADVRAEATRVAESGANQANRVHFVGCERACGSPPAGEVLVATADGYRAMSRRIGPP
jgi:precorrin-3B synthase